MIEKTLKQQLQDQLNAIPSLNEYFNRLPSKTKDWIIEAVIQAFKDWLEQKRQHAEDNQWEKPVNPDPKLNQQWVMKNYKDALKELQEELKQ